MTHSAIIRNIAIEEGKHGMYFATCQEDDDFFIAALSRESLLQIIPEALKNLYNSKNIEVMVFDIESNNKNLKPWTIVPVDLIAAQSQNMLTSIHS